MASFPYSPTVALQSTKFGDLVYLVQPSSSSSSFSLTVLNTSESLSSSDLHTATISSTLPFASGSSVAFTSLISSDDEIFAFSGNCNDGAKGASLWKFTPDTSGTDGSWARKEISTKGIRNPATSAGANYLSSGMAFSGVVNGTSEVYVFGGLCPNTSSQTIGTWQASAQYSNAMLALVEDSDSSADYGLNNVFSRGPPIPEAGFSVSPLSPAFSNSSDGIMTRQQNYVLLGGQTQTAFINMSQVALLSLPQQSWSFIPIHDPQTKTNTDLAARDTSSIDPRSGHSAVLSEAGNQIIVYGGWVGDVTNPADPQLAVLNVGGGYGGSGDWQWAIPDQTGAGPSDAGIFGHGASLLPGNVLMITGGYSIPGGQSNLLKRANPVANANTHFFNVSSKSWISSYSIPSPASSQGTSSSSGGNRKKVGLGAGLGVGLILIAIILAGTCLYRRKKRRVRNVREKDLQALSLGNQRMVSPTLGFGGIDSHMAQEPGSNDAYPWAPALGESAAIIKTRGSEAERTGLLVEIPSPTRGLRRSLHSRGNNWIEDGRRSRGSGIIHPIDERDEYEQEGSHGELGTNPDIAQIAGANILVTAPVLNPFQDHQDRSLLDGSRSPSPQSPAQEREMEIQGWESDWQAAGSLMQQHLTGRLSPDKSDRTSSTLSDKSSLSMVSALSIQPAASSPVSRSVSQRSAALFSSRPLSSSNNTTTHTNTQDRSLSTHSPTRQKHSQSQTIDRINNITAGAGVDTSPSFPRLQSEGQALLGGSLSDPKISPSAPKNSRSHSWIGSMRRALTGTDLTGTSPSLSPGRTASSSPNKHLQSDELTMPQRSASAGALLWRKQQGAKDWGAAGDRRSEVGPSGLTGGPPSLAGTEEEDWDVESAVERRVVQLMFTVPKERLRIVNASPDGDGISVASMEEVVEEAEG